MKDCDPSRLRFSSLKKYLVLLVAICVLYAGTCNAAEYTSSDGYAILLEQSPVDAGYVTPDIGIHEHGKGEILDLRAVPKPGYRFLYWLGDVEASTENETTVQIDSPKIVVAVFTRSSYASAAAGATPSRTPTLLRPSNHPGVGSGSVGIIRDPKEPKDPDPVPEPATLFMLGTGALLSLYKRKKE